MSPHERWSRSLAWLGLVVAGCASQRAARPSGSAELLLPELGASYSSPATWRYHPDEQALVHAREDLGGGRTLLAGERGERWILDANTQKLRAGASLAPEDLVAILRGPEQTFFFVGQSGTSYEAREPLGPFVRSSAPFDRLVEVAAVHGTLLGVRHDQRLMQSSDAGASWNVVGPEPARFVDVEMARDGRALALALPEALFQSEDGGATFTRLPVPAKGVLALERDPLSGGVRAVTPLGALGVEPGPPPALVPADAARAHNARAAKPPRGPNAGALAEGRAVVSGGEYLEAELVDERLHTYQLWRGKLSAPLEQSPLSKAKGCRALRLSAFGRYVTLACFRRGTERTSQPIELYRSENFGQDFEREPFQVHGSLAFLSMAMGEAGQLLMAGVCPATSTAAGCAPDGVHHRRRTKPRIRKKNEKAGKGADSEAEGRAKPAPYELAPSAAPSLVESALALSFSVDGKLAYALGRSGKTGELALFVSKDGGLSFEAEGFDWGSARDAAQELAVEGARVDSIVPAEDGTVGIVLARYKARTLVVTDELGRLLSVSRPPADQVLLGAAGTRALAVDKERRQVLESLDGGATWEAAGRLPIDPCGGDEDCEIPIRCMPEGCVIGHELSRVGWGGQADEDLGSLTPSDAGLNDALERRTLTPIECTLAPQLFRPLPGARELPGAENAALGKAAWFAMGSNPFDASAFAYHGLGGAKPRVDTATLLPPVTRAQAYAFTVVGQIEGAAALRYALPSAGERRITQVELAWDNLFEGRVVKARLRDAGNVLNGDFAQVSGQASLAQPDLLSIAEGGLYVRVHATPKDRQTTYFVDGASVVELPPIPWPESALRQGRAEMARVGSEHLGLLLFGRGAAAVRARRENGAWLFDAGVTGFSEPAAFGVVQRPNITYQGGRAALLVEHDDAGGQRASAHVFELRPDGEVLSAPMRAPTQLDLPREPQPCGTSERSASARVVAPMLPGTRHPVLVSDAVDAPRVMLTGGAVLYGTPESPCAAAFDAEAVPSDVSGSALPETAIIPLDDLEHAWLFRLAAPSGSEVEEVSYRSMSCRFSPQAEVPAEVYRVPGTLAARRRGPSGP